MKPHPMRSPLGRPALLLAVALVWGLGLRAATAQDSQGSWTQRQPLPMALAGAAGAEIGGIFYVAGGETAPDSPLKTLYAYDSRTDSWTPKADMPTARLMPAAGVINGILYVMGGANPHPNDPVAAAEAYDPKTDTWTTKAPLPSARRTPAGCVVNGRLYVIGGITAGGFSAVVECYDPQTDRWTSKTPLPDSTDACAAEVVRGIIYVFDAKSTFAYDPSTDKWQRLAPIAGGFYSLGSMARAVGGVVHLFGGVLPISQYCGTDLAVAYDPAQDRFTDHLKLPIPCVLAASASIGGKIYLAGGARGLPSLCPGGVYYDSLWVFDPHGVLTPPPGSWTRKQDMPMPIAVAAGAELDGILYVAGGDKGLFDQAETLFAYDPATGTWARKQDMPTPRAGPVAGAINGVLYVVGGGNPNTQVWTAATEAYDPQTETWTPKAPMPTARGNMAACVVGGLLYVMGGLTAGNAWSDAVECYDPQTDQWTTKAPVPEPTEACAAATVNGIIYLFTFTKTFAYDTETDAWRQKASRRGSFESANSMAAAIDGLIYLFGGLVPHEPLCGTTYSLVYDPGQDRFTGRRLLPIPCAGAATAVLGGRVLLAGGTRGYPPSCPGSVSYPSLWVFDPQGGVRPEILDFGREGDDLLRFVWRGEAGRRYAVESTANVANQAWPRFMLTTGSTILATNRVVEASGVAPVEAPARFFRVVEAD